jgi:hypothetical protein
LRGSISIRNQGCVSWYESVSHCCRWDLFNLIKISFSTLSPFLSLFIPWRHETPVFLYLYFIFVNFCREFQKTLQKWFFTIKPVWVRKRKHFMFSSVWIYLLVFALTSLLSFAIIYLMFVFYPFQFLVFLHRQTVFEVKWVGGRRIFFRWFLHTHKKNMINLKYFFIPAQECPSRKDLDSIMEKIFPFSCRFHRLSWNYNKSYIEVKFNGAFHGFSLTYLKSKNETCVRFRFLTLKAITFFSSSFSLTFQIEKIKFLKSWVCFTLFVEICFCWLVSSFITKCIRDYMREKISNWVILKINYSSLL